MRDPLFIRVGSSRSFLELSPANRKGGSTCVIRYLSVYDRVVGIFIQKTATLDLASQIKLPGAH